MDWLRAIDNMPGPMFLAVYLLIAGVTIITCKIWVKRLDVTRHLPTPPVPDDPEPIAIAYLRGSENAVTRLTILGLLQRGYLEMVETKKLISTKQMIQQQLDSYLTVTQITLFSG